MGNNNSTRDKSSEIELSIGIQHLPDCPKRRNWVREKLEQLRSESPETPIQVIEDPERNGPWWTHRKTLECCTPTATHHVLLQDDAGLCSDFIATVLEAIAAYPNDIINPYNQSHVSFRARDEGISWLRIQNVWGVGAIWPRRMIQPFLEWEAMHIDPALLDDDIRISMWLRKTNQHAVAMVPSIVEHLGVYDSAFYEGKRATAAWFIGADRSGTEYEWDKGLDRTLDADDCEVGEYWWSHYRDQPVSENTGGN